MAEINVCFICVFGEGKHWIKYCTPCDCSRLLCQEVCRKSAVKKFSKTLKTSCLLGRIDEKVVALYCNLCTNCFSKFEQKKLSSKKLLSFSPTVSPLHDDISTHIYG